MLMHQCNVEDVSTQLSAIMADNAPARLAQLEGYAAMRTTLGSNQAAASAAAIILSAIP